MAKNLKDYINYRHYINSDLWKIKKIIIRNGADGSKQRRCKVCKEWCYTQVHHRTYNRLGNEKKKDLIEVCSNCHNEIHNLEKKGMWLYTIDAYLKAKKRRIREKLKKKLLHYCRS